MGNPTPKQPIILNDDGTLSVLVYRGRTFRLNAIHAGLAYPPTGYKARLGMTDKYGNPLVASANSEDGDITFTDASLLVPPKTGTVIRVVVTDEETGTIDVKAGKFDLVLENPSGQEDPVAVGDFLIYKDVSP